MLVSISDLFRGQAALQPFLDRAVGLSTIYDDYLENDEGDAHLRRPGLHASELGCERRAFYTLIGAEKNPRVPKKWKKRFEHGKVIHKMVQDQWHGIAARSGGLIEFDDEVKVAKEYQKIAAELELDSSADGIIRLFDRPGGEVVIRVGLEVKSEAPDGFEDLKRPKPEHVEQVHLYMKALDIPIFWFFYFNKGDQENTPSLHPWVIVYQEKIWNEVETKCRRLLQFAEEYRARQPGSSDDAVLAKTRTRLQGNAAPLPTALPDRKEGIWCEFCPYREPSVCNPEYLIKKNERKARKALLDPRALRS